MTELVDMDKTQFGATSSPKEVRKGIHLYPLPDETCWSPTTTCSSSRTKEQQRLGTDTEVLLLLLETSVDCSVSWMGPRETKYRQVMISWPYKQGKSQITGAHQLVKYLLGHPVHLPDTMKLFLVVYFLWFFVSRLNFLSDIISKGEVVLPRVSCCQEFFSFLYVIIFLLFTSLCKFPSFPSLISFN